MTTVAATHIVLDEQGRALVAGTRTKVTLIVRDKMGGMTPEQIHEEYPYLSLAQIHAALAHYYDHQREFDSIIEREDREVAALRAASQQPSRAELEQRLRERKST